MRNKRQVPGARHTTSIEWSEIYYRLNAAHDRESPQQKKTILIARARKLALAPTKSTDAEQFIEVVEFLLAYEPYAIESSYIREVYPLKDLTPVPCTPPFVVGIMNVRGQILSVIDIKKFFGLPEKGLTELNKVLIVHNRAMEFGILADAILGIRSIALEEIQPPLPTLTGIRQEYLRGIARERLAVLDAEKLLSDEKIIMQRT